MAGLNNLHLQKVAPAIARIDKCPCLRVILTIITTTIILLAFSSAALNSPFFFVPGRAQAVFPATSLLKNDAAAEDDDGDGEGYGSKMFVIMMVMMMMPK